MRAGALFYRKGETPRVCSSSSACSNWKSKTFGTLEMASGYGFALSLVSILPMHSRSGASRTFWLTKRHKVRYAHKQHRLGFFTNVTSVLPMFARPGHPPDTLLGSAGASSRSSGPPRGRDHGIISVWSYRSIVRANDQYQGVPQCLCKNGVRYSSRD